MVAVLEPVYNYCVKQVSIKRISKKKSRQCRNRSMQECTGWQSTVPCTHTATLCGSASIFQPCSLYATTFLIRKTRSVRLSEYRLDLVHCVHYGEASSQIYGVRKLEFASSSQVFTYMSDLHHAFELNKVKKVFIKKNNQHAVLEALTKVWHEEPVQWKTLAEYFMFCCSVGNLRHACRLSFLRSIL